MIDFSSFGFLGGVAKDAETESMLANQSAPAPAVPESDIELAQRLYKESGSAIKAMALKIHQLGSNMVELELGDTWILFSYSTPVAARVPGEGWFRTEKFHSMTTSRHINKWLGGREAATMPQEFFDGLADQSREVAKQATQEDALTAALKPYEGKKREDVVKAIKAEKIRARLTVKAEFALVEADEYEAGAPGFMKLEGLGAGYNYYNSISDEALAESNHGAALAGLRSAAEDPANVIVVGGDIFVKSDDNSAMAKAKEIIAELENYPILDESDFSDKEMELVDETIESNGLIRDAERELGWGVDGDTFLEQKASDETKALFAEVPEENREEVWKLITDAIEGYPGNQDDLHRAIYNVYSYSGEAYVPELEEFLRIAEQQGNGDEEFLVADDAVKAVIKDWLDSRNPGSAKSMREKEDEGQQRLPQVASLKAAETESKTEAEPKAEEAAKAEPVTKVTDEKPVTEIKELKPKSTSIDLARAAKVLPEVVVALYKHVQEDEAVITKLDERLTKITKAVRTRKESREAKRVERLALLAKELKDSEDRMGRVVEGAVEHALQWDPGTESSKKVIERKWSEVDLAKAAEIKALMAPLRDSLTKLDKELKAIEESQPITKEVIQPRILKFPLKSEKIVAGIMDSLAGFVKSLAAFVRGPLNDYNKALDELEDLMGAEPSPAEA